MQMNIITVTDLVRRFGDLTAVDGVSFQVKEGEIFGFLGPNGAGKTTTINMLCTILRPTDGHATVGGHDVVRSPMSVRRNIGIIFQDPSLDDKLTARENLDFHARIYGVPSSERAGRIQDVLEMVELDGRMNDLVRVFSGGMKRRLEIARGLIHHPRVLFLDEPTLGLDPQTRRHIWEYLLDLRKEKGVTLFLTTHYMEEAENCDRIAIIDNGKIIAVDTPVGLKDGVGGDVITLHSENSEELAAQINSRYEVEATATNGSVSFSTEDGEEFIPRLFRDLSTEIGSVNLRRPTLEDVFVQMTGRAIREEEADNTDRMRQHARAWRSRR